MEKAEKIKLVKDAVKSYKDFPQDGIIFRDIFGIFRSASALRALKDLILEHVAFLEFDVVVGLDSRGFLLGPIISLELAKPFIPVRKKGKLPGKVIEQKYSMEYKDNDVIQIQTDGLKGVERALIVDDLIATGGTMAAAEKLLKSVGVKVVECFSIMELTSLQGRKKLEAPVHSILQFP